ncbi:MAG: polyisoprenyl-phosphate glycosyltransferase [Alphaproteobacteria bacterium]|jgi:glycosyltransferase involved in cell wall biosynthesis|nr:polyisoprenyl-phosphate glycosyltransferase [Alphaproteobacteria bacterium]
MAASATSLGTGGVPARARGRADAGLSFVVPLFNEAANLPALHARIAEVARTLKATRRLTAEVVYVDDGSRDATLTVARGLAADVLDVQVVSLSRNFGKEAALLAGLDHARFGAVLFMDGDGQHPPSLVETLVGYWLDQGYDVVYTAKAHRENESWLRRVAVRGFYAIINWGARQKIPEDAGDFRLLSPRAAAALRQLPERNRFFKGLASWIGFRQIRVDYEPAARAHGSSTWNLYSLVGLSIEGLTSFSVAPLRLASLLGLLLAGAAFVFGVQILVETVFFGQSVPGYPSVVVGLMVLGGVQLIMIGIMGEYIGKILSELKARPVYFVAEHDLKTAEGAGRADDPQARSAAE